MSDFSHFAFGHIGTDSLDRDLRFHASFGDFDGLSGGLWRRRKDETDSCACSTGFYQLEFKLSVMITNMDRTIILKKSPVLRYFRQSS